MNRRYGKKPWLWLLLPGFVLPLLAAENQGGLTDLCLSCGDASSPAGQSPPAAASATSASEPSALLRKGNFMPGSGPEEDGETFACTLTSVELQRRRESIKTEILSRATSRERTAKAWVLTFPGDADLLKKLMEFIVLERECCAFLQFKLDVEPYGRATRLELGGPPAALDFVGSFLSREPGDLGPEEGESSAS